MSPDSVCPPAEPLLNGCKSSGNGVYRNRIRSASGIVAGPVRCTSWAQTAKRRRRHRHQPNRWGECVARARPVTDAWQLSKTLFLTLKAFLNGFAED